MVFQKYINSLLLSVILTMTGISIASAAPDLVITTGSAPAEIELGVPFTISVTMANQGDSDVESPANGFSVYYYAYLSLDNSYDTSDICAGSGGISYQDLKAGAIRSGEASAQVNAENTPPGAYYIIFKADALCHFDGHVAESDETNNTYSGGIITANESTAVVDLTMTNLVGPTIAARDTWLRLDASITNLGPDSAPGRADSSCGHYTSFYLSTDTTITTSDLLLSRICLNSLAGGATYRWFKDILIPGSVPRGAYYWGVIADYTEILPETDETNNALSATGSVRVR